MPDQTLTTPTGQQGEQWATSVRTEDFLYDPSTTATTVLSNGMVVIIAGGWTLSGGFQTTTGVSLTQIPVVRKQTTTPAFTNIGVVVNAPTGGYVPGQVVQVAVDGLVQILCDANNTTYGQWLINGSTTAGAATASATSTEGHTIAKCMQTATIASGTALVFGKLCLI